MKNLGKLIVIDSIDGAGKTSLIKGLCEDLRNKGFDVIESGEPGGTPIANDIRGLLLNKGDEQFHDLTELLLMFASRNQHYQNLIRPALNEGKLVICSRFTSSTYAYQHYAREIDINKIKALEQMVLGDFRPDKTIILDLDPESSLSRVRGRGELDRIEEEKIEFFHKARHGYLAQASEMPQLFDVIDASQSKEAVLSSALSIINGMLNG
jgi:dTMP kinase